MIYIISPGRSGSSALARVLDLAGISLPSTVMAPSGDVRNPTGFWEDLAVNRLNDEILAKTIEARLREKDSPRDVDDRYWANIKDFTSLWRTPPPFLEEYTKKAAAYLGGCAGPRLGVVKDGRLSRTLPLWIEASRRANIAPYALHALRHPVEVSRSLEKHYSFLRPRSLLIWWRYTLDAIKHSASIPYGVISYDRLLDDWRAALGRISDQLGLDFGVIPVEKCVEIDHFLKPSQREFRVHETDDSLPVPLQRLYEALCEVEAGPMGRNALVALAQESETDFQAYLADALFCIEDRRILAQRETERFCKALQQNLETVSRRYEGEVAWRRKITGSLAWKLVWPFFR